MAIERATSSQAIWMRSTRCVARTYKYRLSGNMTQQARVDAVVMATDSARSALHRLHQKPEKPPDGLVQIVINVTAVIGDCGNNHTTNAYPTNGMIKKWHAMATRMLRSRVSWRMNSFGSHEPAIPASSRNNRTCVTTSTASEAIIMVGRRATKGFDV